jgi:FKBP-type peptidyl-prolyl cis-trans isomerase
MRQFGILLLLGLLLAFIAWQARTGIFRRANPGEPANKYMRQILESPQLSEADAALIRERYQTAHTNPSGLRYLVRAPGEGRTPGINREVAFHYEAFLLDGRKFDSSRDRGEPFVTRISTGSVIKGLDEALAAMRVGEKRTLIIPWWLGYGAEGRPPAIPPKATLVYEVELIAIR